MSPVDCVVMGRETYETVRAFARWPFDGKLVTEL